MTVGSRASSQMGASAEVRLPKTVVHKHSTGAKLAKKVLNADSSLQQLDQISMH